jgi:hypothetical protein
VRGRGEDGLQAGRHRDAAVEAFQLRGDLALIVIHGDHAVEFTLECPDIDCVGRIRSGAVDALLGQRFYGGSDHLDLVATKQSTLARMGVERRHRDARVLDTGIAQHFMHQGNGIGDRLRRNLLDGLTERYVSSHAGHPLAVEHVHLGEVGLMFQQMGKHLVLVGKLPSTCKHRGLVERREGDRIDMAFAGDLNGASQRVTRELARFRRGRTAREHGRINVAQIDQGDEVVDPIDLASGGDAAHVEFHTCILHAAFEHPGVAYQHDLRNIVHTTVREDTRALLGADARAVAHGQGDAWLGTAVALEPGVGGVVSRGHGASPDRQ